MHNKILFKDKYYFLNLQNLKTYSYLNSLNNKNITKFKKIQYLNYLTTFNNVEKFNFIK